MTPQRARELEAELRRLAADYTEMADSRHSRDRDYWMHTATSAAFIDAADLVRDAAGEGGE